MRRYAILTTTAALVLILAASSLPAEAHRPEKMTIVYNERLEVLTVSITHDVKDKTTHYVEMIEVYVDDALLIERTFDSQPRNTYNERFALEASEGDIIRVKACCNIEGCTEREMEVGSGLSVEGDREQTVNTAVAMHAMVQVLAFVLALVAIPGGMGFYRAWRTKTKPKGKRRMHIRIGNASVALWGIGSLAGIWIVYMTSGDYLGSLHGWMALATFASALFAGWAGSPNFRKAGYAARMQTHMPLALLTVILGVATITMGMMTAGWL